MKKIIRWLFNKEVQYVTFVLPTKIVYALETVKYMQNSIRPEDDQMTNDDIVTIALAEFFQRNLWTNVVEDVKIVAQPIIKEVSYEKEQPTSLPHSTQAAHKKQPTQQQTWRH